MALARIWNLSGAGAPLTAAGAGEGSGPAAQPLALPCPGPRPAAGSTAAPTGRGSVVGRPAGMERVLPGAAGGSQRAAAKLPSDRPIRSGKKLFP